MKKLATLTIVTLALAGTTAFAQQAQRAGQAAQRAKKAVEVVRPGTSTSGARVNQTDITGGIKASGTGSQVSGNLFSQKNADLTAVELGSKCDASAGMAGNDLNGAEKAAFIAAQGAGIAGGDACLSKVKGKAAKNAVAGVSASNETLKGMGKKSIKELATAEQKAIVLDAFDKQLAKDINASEDAAEENRRGICDRCDILSKGICADDVQDKADAL